jgi:ABC-type branched-subunit amino acid transport system permease subunit
VAILQRIRNAPPRYWLVAMVVLFFLGFPTVVSSFQAAQWTQALILVIAIMGLNILVGYSGQLSLGHGAFMAIGAYTTAILVHRYKVDFLLTIPIAALLTGIVGFLFGVPALRLSALYLRWQHLPSRSSCPASSSDRKSSRAAYRGSAFRRLTHPRLAKTHSRL